MIFFIIVQSAGGIQSQTNGLLVKIFRILNTLQESRPRQALGAILEGWEETHTKPAKPNGPNSGLLLQSKEGGFQSKKREWPWVLRENVYQIVCNYHSVT